MSDREIREWDASHDSGGSLRIILQVSVAAGSRRALTVPLSPGGRGRTHLPLRVLPLRFLEHGSHERGPNMPENDYSESTDEERLTGRKSGSGFLQKRRREVIIM